MVIFDVGISGLKKNQWIELSQSQKKQYAQNIFALIENAYKNLGGHPNYLSAKNVYTTEGNADYIAIDFDEDPYIDAVQIMKRKPSGRKLVATGQDGQKKSRKAVVEYISRVLKRPYFYAEVSGKLKDILVSNGVPTITSPSKIRAIMKGKKIVVHRDGTYTRKIGGKNYTKMLVGVPNI